MRLLLGFLLISIVIIFPINKEVLAGGGLYWNCNTSDFGRNCFAYKTINMFFNDTFFSKKEFREKFTREKISIVWSSLSRASKHSGAIANTNLTLYEREVRRERERKKRIKKRYSLYLKKNKYLKKISKLINFKLSENWCLQRIDRVLDFSEAIMKENPGNENAKRIGAARFLVQGDNRDWCLLPIKYGSEKPSDVQKLLSELLLKVKQSSVDDSKKLRPWILYMKGAEYFNSGHLEMAYNSFQKVIITSKKRTNFQKWPFETSYYMKLRITFHEIRGTGHVWGYDYDGKIIKSQHRLNVIKLWREELANFRNQFPSSLYLPHAEQMSIGLYYLAGDKKKYLKLHLNELTRILEKVEKNELAIRPHIWSFVNRFAFYLNDEPAFSLSFVRRNHHPKIKIMYALVNGIDAKSEPYLCSENIDPTRDFSNKMLFDICQNYKDWSYPNLSDYQHTGLEVEMTYLAFLTALDKNDFEGAKSFLEKILKIAKGNLENRDQNYLTIAIGRWFKKSLNSSRVTYYFKNELSQIVKKESSPLITLIRAYQLEVFSRHFANPKDFMLLLESAESELDRFALLFPHFSQALLYNDRETAIVLAEKVSFEKLLRNKILGHSNYYLEAIKAVKDVYHELRHNSKSSKSDFLIGSFLHLQGIMPSCSEYPPSPLDIKAGRQSCGYMRFTTFSRKAVFVIKKLTEPSLNPIDLFRKVVSKTLYSSNPLEKLEIATLNRMIYCLKGKRIESCVRGATVKKSEVKSWFRRINFKEKRQKYWFFQYEDVDSNVFSAPYCFRCREPYEGLQSDYYVIK